MLDRDIASALEKRKEYETRFKTMAAQQQGDRAGQRDADQRQPISRPVLETKQRVERIRQRLHPACHVDIELQSAAGRSTNRQHHKGKETDGPGNERGSIVTTEHA